MEIISTIALISINETLILQVVSFLIFLYLINRIMLRPLRNVMADREIYIERVQMDIAETGKKIQAISSQIRKQESAAKKEAFELREKLEAEGSRQAEEIFRAVGKEITATREKVHNEIAARISESRQSLKLESEVLALKIIEKILDRRQVP